MHDYKRKENKKNRACIVKKNRVLQYKNLEWVEIPNNMEEREKGMSNFITIAQSTYIK